MTVMWSTIFGDDNGHHYLNNRGQLVKILTVPMVG